MEEIVRRVHGVLCTDSRGGFDAVEVNESPLLGLANLRSALQAFQLLRDHLKRTGCELRWVASDYDLGDALTKKRLDSRLGLQRFLQSWKCDQLRPDIHSGKEEQEDRQDCAGQARCSSDKSLSPFVFRCNTCIEPPCKDATFPPWLFMLRGPFCSQTPAVFRKQCHRRRPPFVCRGFFEPFVSLPLRSRYSMFYCLLVYLFI